MEDYKNSIEQLELYQAIGGKRHQTIMSIIGTGRFLLETINRAISRELGSSYVEEMEEFIREVYIEPWKDYLGILYSAVARIYGAVRCLIGNWSLFFPPYIRK